MLPIHKNIIDHGINENVFGFGGMNDFRFKPLLRIFFRNFHALNWHLSTLIDVANRSAVKFVARLVTFDLSVFLVNEKSV